MPAFFDKYLRCTLPALVATARNYRREVARDTSSAVGYGVSRTYLRIFIANLYGCRSPSSVRSRMYHRLKNMPQRTYKLLSVHKVIAVARNSPFAFAYTFKVSIIFSSVVIYRLQYESYAPRGNRCQRFSVDSRSQIPTSLDQIHHPRVHRTQRWFR